MTERDIEFPNGEPDYWYAEFGAEEKILEIGLDDVVIKIPQETVLSWMMISEYNDLKAEDKEE